MLKITIEGPQGCGKSRVARAVFAMMSQVGGYVVAFKDGDDQFNPIAATQTAIVEVKQTP